MKRLDFYTPCKFFRVIFLKFQALSLDDGNVYHERLEVALRRLELRAQLYKQPDRPEDQAAMIIEQVCWFSHCMSTLSPPPKKKQKKNNNNNIQQMCIQSFILLIW